ncbi:MAG: glycine betaine ABC transporter substrate-binding protein [Micrococcus sp.]|nr:glycine betaine ABC transporter substrate-binding protein [Micrococcus sp.]
MRARRRRPGAALTALAAATALSLSACTAGPSVTESPQPEDAPVRVAHTDAALDVAVAALIERHLRNRGHAVDTLEPASRPWESTDETTVAVMDTLEFAVRHDADAVMPAPPLALPTEPAEPTDDATAEPDEEGTSEPTDEADAEPTDQAEVSPTPPENEPGEVAETSDDVVLDGEPTDATPSPTITALPVGRSALSAEAVDEVVRTHLQDGVGILVSAPGTLRIRTVLTAATAARLEAERLEDLNARCDELPAATSPLFSATVDPAAGLRFQERLDRLAGCRPSAWEEPVGRISAELVAGAVALGMTYGVEPEIEENALVILEDPSRILPEGRVAVVGHRDELPEAVASDIRDVVGRLDEDGLRALLAASTGADALSPEDAAQYWLVTHDMEAAPEDWFVPPTSWF